ncbi:MAG TPA: TIGR03086 family metal-binding protein [Nocardioides sp.]|nr:TIGR03086 family metal-binding protein [Nocardioides sp.]
MAPLDPAVELLDRALSYTRVILHEVTDADLPRRTPCERWDLGQLLAHMEDALDAFSEGAHGAVDLHDRVPVRVRVGNLQQKACALLADWTRETPDEVRIGSYRLETPVVVLAAALEITVHGWDVGQALGVDRRIPEALAHGLLPVAEALLAESDRGSQFGAPRPAPADAPYDARLLGFLGRETDRQITGITDTGEAAAS